MVRDHEAVNKQALDLVKKLKVTPEDNDTSKTLSKQAADKLAELAKLKGAEYDKAYVANEVAYHKAVNGALETQLIPSASNAELKSLLQTGLKIFQGHQQHAEHVAAEPEVRRPPCVRDAICLIVAALLFGAIAVPAHAATIQITMENLVFAPAEVSAKVGDTIEWINKDVFAHTATARNGDFDVTMPPKKTVTSVLKKAGTVEYYCRYHPNMKAVLTIEP